MTGLWKKAGLGAVMAATVLTAAVPADAQRWRGGGYRGHRGGGDVAAGAVIGGLLGLGVGAAIASGNRNRGYDRGYYGGGYYGGGGYDRGYYAPPPPPRYRGYDDGGYYQQRCWTQWRYDPYYGDRVPVQVCN